MGSRLTQMRSAAQTCVVFASAMVLPGTFSACGPNDGGGAPDPFVEVSIQNSAFQPREITITRGQTVRWSNDDPVFHTVTSGNPGDPDAGALFDSDDLLPFDNFTFQFNDVGEFVYHSRLDIGRPGMVGAKIIVTE